ncbi:hypothetical protein AB0467_19085 [Streptomyces sp. NPDC052095]|uniref:hypothetical protein n=1 Tax=unclassified Streptomyces TaxID=2593676 RepID=UPI00344F724D
MAPTPPPEKPAGTPPAAPPNTHPAPPRLAPYATAAPTSVPVTTAASIPVITAPAHPPSPPHPAPPGRTRHGFALGLAVASVVPAVVLGGTSVAPASAARSTSSAPAPGPSAAPAPAPGPGAVPTPGPSAACGDPAAKDFPLTTRIHGGPDTYSSGGGYGTWFLDLTNTTAEPCRAVHPVLVLTDADRRLTSDQIQLQFSEQARPGTEHRVSWETTDQDEHIGVFGGTGGDTFAGFTVPAGRTVTVRVRMAFTSDTSPGRITANAVVVQRQRVAGKDDGAWIGESDDYPFTVVDENGDGTERDTGGTTEPPAATATTGPDEPGTAESVPDGPRTPPPAADPGDPDPGGPDADDPDLPELAATGTDPLTAPALAATGLLIAGGAMVVTARRLRRDRT